MTREIKFRAWDKTNSQMFYSDFIVQANGVVLWWYSEEGYELIRDDIVIMQYTGLHDKNGKEIYEFDQLKGDWDVVDDIYLGTVEFYGGAFRIRETGLPLAWADKDKDCEVVGNKFEGLQNPSKGDIM